MCGGWKEKSEEQVSRWARRGGRRKRWKQSGDEE